MSSLIRAWPPAPACPGTRRTCRRSIFRVVVRAAFFFLPSYITSPTPTSTRYLHCYLIYAARLDLEQSANVLLALRIALVLVLVTHRVPIQLQRLKSVADLSAHRLLLLQNDTGLSECTESTTPRRTLCDCTRRAHHTTDRVRQRTTLTG